MPALLSLLVGLVLVVAPWLPLWEWNWLLPHWPVLRDALLSGFARGAVTGLGLVNVVVALSDVYARLSPAPRGD